jgi:ABC-type lipoprotein release transport system permease subunit
MAKTKSVTSKLQYQYGKSDMTVSPWQIVAKSFYNAMKADKEGMYIMLIIMIIIVAVGVLNTVMMAVLERTREYGVLRAIGTKPKQIFLLVIYEITILAIFSIIIGSVIGLAGVYYMTEYGVDIGEDIGWGGVTMSTLRAEYNLRSFIIPAIIVLFTAVFVSIFPALRAAKIAPAKAMRIH